MKLSFERNLGNSDRVIRILLGLILSGTGLLKLLYIKKRLKKTKKHIGVLNILEGILGY